MLRKERTFPGEGEKASVTGRWSHAMKEEELMDRGQKVFQAEGTAYAKLTGLLMSFQVARPQVKARDFLSSTSNQTSTYKPLTKTQGHGKCVNG